MGRDRIPFEYPPERFDVADQRQLSEAVRKTAVGTREALRQIEPKWNVYMRTGSDLVGSLAAHSVNRHVAGGLIGQSTFNLQIPQIFHMPHDWALGSPVRPHIHFSKLVGGGGSADDTRWEAVWLAGKIGDTLTNLGNSALWTSLGTKSVTGITRGGVTIGADNDNQDEHTVIELGEIDLSDYTMDTLLFIEFRRLGLSETGSPSDTPIHAVDIHYLVDSRGSRLEWNKDR